MSDYKLVPVEPTAEMAEAAQDAYMPFGDMNTAIMMAVLAAPAVQGEPVATIHVDGSFVHVAWRIPAPSRCAMDVYTAPQPAEQQPISAYACTVPDDCETLHWRGQILSMNELVSVAQPAVDEEIHVHIEGRDVLTLPLASSGMSAPRFVVHVPARQPAEQQPAPDVAGLVEALEELMLRAHPAYVHDDLMREKLIAARELGHAALSSHREQQPAPDVAMRVMEALAAILRKAQGRTDTETGECIDVGAECMAIRREFDRSSKAARGVSGLADAAEAALGEIEDIMQEAYNSAYPVCCGRPGSECCGSPEPEWEEADQRMMDRLDPHQKALREALAAHRKGGEA